MRKMLSIVIIGILTLIFVSGCAEAVFVYEQAPLFCEAKGYDDWRFDTLNPFGLDFICVNDSKDVRAIQDYYVGG